MVELCIALIVIGFLAVTAQADGNESGAVTLAVIVGVLLVIYAIVKKGKKETARNSNGYK